MVSAATTVNCVVSQSEQETPVETDWGQWLERFAPRFLLFARQQARSEADAQDLVQEAVVASWRRCQDGSPPLPAVVFATIRRRAIDKARAEDRRAARENMANLAAPEAWFDCDIEE